MGSLACAAHLLHDNAGLPKVSSQRTEIQCGPTVGKITFISLSVRIQTVPGGLVDLSEAEEFPVVAYERPCRVGLTNAQKVE